MLNSRKKKVNATFDMSKRKVGDKITHIAGVSSDDGEETSLGASKSCNSDAATKVCVVTCKIGCSGVISSLQDFCIKRCATRICRCNLKSSFWMVLFVDYSKHLLLAMQLKLENGQQQVVVDQSNLNDAGKLFRKHKSLIYK